MVRIASHSSRYRPYRMSNVPLVLSRRCAFNRACAKNRADRAGKRVKVVAWPTYAPWNCPIDDSFTVQNDEFNTTKGYGAE
jgi:hypothetical protein